MQIFAYYEMVANCELNCVYWLYKAITRIIKLISLIGLKLSSPLFILTQTVSYSFKPPPTEFLKLSLPLL